MDPEVRRVVEAEWSSRFGLPVSVLRDAGLHVVAADLGTNDAMSFRLDRCCVVVVRPDALDAARDRLSGLEVDAAFTAEALRHLVGPAGRVDGPSWHGYVTERTFRGEADGAVLRLEPTDAALLACLREGDRAEWAESGFPLDPSSADPATTRFYGVAAGHQLVAIGNMTDWRGLPADVGLLTRPAARGQGLATRLAQTMVADALPTAGVVRYRALVANAPSLAIANRLGVEGFGQNYRARRATS